MKAVLVAFIAAFFVFSEFSHAQNAGPKIPAPASGIPKPLPANHLIDVLKREKSGLNPADASTFTGTVKIGGAVLDAARSALQIVTLKIEASQAKGGLITIAPDTEEGWGGYINLQRKSDNLFWHISGPRGEGDNGDLTFFYNNNSYHPVLTLQNDGKVGIGTTAPGAALDVSTVAAEARYMRVNAPNTQLKGLQLYSNTNTLDWEVVSTATDRLFSIGETAGANRLVINRSGDVGIGTKAPGYDLEVKRTSSNAEIISNYNDTNIGRLTAASNGNVYIGVDRGTGSLAVGTTNYPTALNIIGSSGNVGIGTATPDAKLSVESGSNPLIGRFESESSNKLVNGIRIDAKNENGIFTYFDLAVDPTNTKVGLGIGTHSGNLPIGKQNLNEAELVITDAGNVGIGTTIPGDYRLNVSGKTYLGGNSTLLAVGESWGEGLNIDSPPDVWGGIKWRRTNRSEYTGNWHLGYMANDTDNKLYLWEGNDSKAVATFQHDGNVGIGTPTPGSKLHVVGSAFFDQGADCCGIFFRQENAGRLRVGAAWGTPGLYSEDNQDIVLGVASGKKALIGSYGNFMTVQGDGNVGIGTPTPGSKLHVVGSAFFDQGADCCGIFFRQENAGRLRVGAAWGTPGLYSEDNQDIVLGVASGKKALIGSYGNFMTVQGDGNVGIGTTGPERKLDISFSKDNSKQTDPRETDGIRVVNTNNTVGTYSALTFGSNGTASGIGSRRVSNDAQDIFFFSEGGAFEKMTIKANGNVGIGIQPNSVGYLQLPGVSRNRYKSLGINEDRLKIGSDTTSGHGAIFAQGGGAMLEVGAQGAIQFTTGDVAGLATERMRINKDGSVVIGKWPDKSAEGILDVYGGSTYLINRYDKYDINRPWESGILRLVNRDTANGNLISLNFEGRDAKDTQLTAGAIALQYVSHGEGDLDTKMHFGTTNNSIYGTRMTIDNVGNVGIGTTNPGANLEVRSTVLVNGPQTNNYSASAYEWKATDSNALWHLGFRGDKSQEKGNLTFWYSPDPAKGNNWKSPLSLDSNGSVGIGYTWVRRFRLAVNGYTAINGNLAVKSMDWPQTAIEVGDNGWITLRPRPYDAGLVFYESGVRGGNYGEQVGNGARIFYHNAEDKLVIQTMNNQIEKSGITIARATGNVGIGKDPSDKKLDVFGDINVTYGGSHVASREKDRIGFDVAELFTAEESVEVGDVLVVGKTDRTVRKSRKQHEDALIGVVSGSPAIVFEGDNLLIGSKPYRFQEGTKPPVALAGRVPVKVSTENGFIRTGDYLMTSSISGVAMKAEKGMPIIGIALESYKGYGIGTILMFININQNNASDSYYILESRIRKLEKELSSIKQKQ